jgi:hypothetical protein
MDGQGTILSARFAPREPLGRDPGAGRGVRVGLPVAGRWWVFWGGRNELRNYHVVAPDQRHAIDLVRWERGGTARGAGEHNRDYAAWAPAWWHRPTAWSSPRGVRDNRPRVQIANEDDPAGNHVMLRLDKGAFALLGHLRWGSVRVRRGDAVSAGEMLGRVGNSGNSSEPHLHFHVQHKPRLSRGVGLPVRFRGVVVDGARRAAAAALQGSFIAPAP